LGKLGLGQVIHVMAAYSWGSLPTGDLPQGKLDLERPSKCFLRECDLRSIPLRRELLVPIEYTRRVFEEPLRLDFLVDDVLILEFKVVEEVLPVHKAQLLSYMKLLKHTVGPAVQLS